VNFEAHKFLKLPNHFLLRKQKKGTGFALDQKEKQNKTKQKPKENTKPKSDIFVTYHSEILIAILLRAQHKL